jgi:probable rRNA maturation factor
MIEVVSRQRRRKIDCQSWQAFSEKALHAIGKNPGDVTIAFVSDRRIRDLNKRFRKHDQATDVLSFPADSDGSQQTFESALGDIAISLERAEAQALENGLEVEQEIAQLILHGLLHLCGYDHETDQGEMNRLELRLRRRLEI